MKNVAAKSWTLPAIGGVRYSSGVPRRGLRFVPNDTNDDDFATLSEFPPNWGNGEFTLTLLVRAMPVGSTAWGTIDLGSTVSVKKRRWSNNNTALYSNPDHWIYGNFLLDAFNNSNGLRYAGSLSLQTTNSGQLQWLLGDGAAADARVGDVHALRSTSTILDGEWHRVTLVRRWDGGTGAILELWVDGVLEDTETTTARTQMYNTYWNGWALFPSDERYMAIGAEKISGNDGNPWEDWMGDVAELAFIGRAFTEEECEDWQAPVTASTSGVSGLYLFTEQSGPTAADSLGNGGDIELQPNSDSAPIWFEEAA